MDLFKDVLNSITFSKIDVVNTEEDEKEFEKTYVPFVVNRGLSYFVNTIMYANLMNQNPQIPKRLQYLYLLNTVRKEKRFSKWHKKQAKSEDLIAVQKYFQVSLARAQEYMKLLTPDHLKEIHSLLDEGGIVNERPK